MSTILNDPRNKDIPHLPFAEVGEVYKNDDDLPCVSITIPCYKRRKFIPLMLSNIISQNYPPNKIEVVILQDGVEDLFETPEHKKMFEDTISPRKLKYVYEGPRVRRSIGDKRNKLVKMASHKIIASMDSDDIYFHNYLRISVNALKQYKAGITSSAAMLFTYPNDGFKITAIRCGYKEQGHEATCVFTKKHFKSMGGFRSKGEGSSRGEGSKMIWGGENKMVNLDIKDLMCCVGHVGDEGNTIDKEQFKHAHIDGNLDPNSTPIKILENIFGVKHPKNA
jgi:hypothetical protein